MTLPRVQKDWRLLCLEVLHWQMLEQRDWKVGVSFWSSVSKVMHLVYGSLLDNHILIAIYSLNIKIHMSCLQLFITGVVITQKTMDNIFITISLGQLNWVCHFSVRIWKMMQVGSLFSKRWKLYKIGGLQTLKEVRRSWIYQLRPFPVLYVTIQQYLTQDSDWLCTCPWYISTLSPSTILIFMWVDHVMEISQ